MFFVNDWRWSGATTREMVYTEADVFKEAAADRKRLVKWDARKYKEVRREVPAFSPAAETRVVTLTMRTQVWLAFCKWIVERFDKGRGVATCARITEAAVCIRGCPQRGVGTLQQRLCV